jgi:ribosomal protein L37AE/L43A
MYKAEETEKASYDCEYCSHISVSPRLVPLVLIRDSTILRIEHTVLHCQLRSEFQRVEVDIWHNTQVDDRSDDSQAKQPLPANMRLK